MAEPYWVNFKYALQRPTFVLKGGGFLCGLNKLAETARKEFQKIAEEKNNNREEWQKSREQSLRLDFIQGKIGTELPIPGTICEVMRNAEIREISIKLDAGDIFYTDTEFPDKELRVAIKFALRELAMNGMPRHPKTIDLSSTKSAESHRGYQLGVKVRARASLCRVSTWNAGLSLFYHIDAGRVPLSIVNFTRKIDD
jgi:hypothetical protein